MSAEFSEDAELPGLTRVERFTAGFDLRARFPAAELIAGGEGGAVYTAQQDGAYIVITDESALAEFLEPDDTCVTVYTFGTTAHRDSFCAARYGELLKRAEARRHYR